MESPLFMDRCNKMMAYPQNVGVSWIEYKTKNKIWHVMVLEAVSEHW